MKKVLILLLAVVFNVEMVYAQDYYTNDSNVLLTNNIISPYSTIYKTDNKKININKNCDSTKCIINITLEWINMPKIRSYDVLGARFEGTSLLNEPTTTLFLDGVKKKYNYVYSKKK